MSLNKVRGFIGFSTFLVIVYIIIVFITEQVQGFLGYRDVPIIFPFIKIFEELTHIPFTSSKFLFTIIKSFIKTFTIILSLSISFYIFAIKEQKTITASSLFTEKRDYFFYYILGLVLSLLININLYFKFSNISDNKLYIVTQNNIYLILVWGILIVWNFISVIVLIPVLFKKFNSKLLYNQTLINFFNKYNKELNLGKRVLGKSNIYKVLNKHYNKIQYNYELESLFQELHHLYQNKQGEEFKEGITSLFLKLCNSHKIFSDINIEINNLILKKSEIINDFPRIQDESINLYFNKMPLSLEELIDLNNDIISYNKQIIDFNIRIIKDLQKITPKRKIWLMFYFYRFLVRRGITNMFIILQLEKMADKERLRDISFKELQKIIESKKELYQKLTLSKNGQKYILLRHPNKRIKKQYLKMQSEIINSKKQEQLLKLYLGNRERLYFSINCIIVENFQNLTTNLYKEGHIYLGNRTLEILFKMKEVNSNESLEEIYKKILTELTAKLDLKNQDILRVLLTRIEETSEVGWMNFYIKLMIRTIEDGNINALTTVTHSFRKSLELTNKGKSYDSSEEEIVSRMNLADKNMSNRKEMLIPILAAVKSIEISRYSATGFIVKFLVTNFKQEQLENALELLLESKYFFIDPALREQDKNKDFGNEGMFSYDWDFNNYTFEYCFFRLIILIYGQQKFLTDSQYNISENKVNVTLNIKKFLQDCTYSSYLLSKIYSAKDKYGLIYLKDANIMNELKQTLNVKDLIGE